MDRTIEDSRKGPSYLVYEFERRAYPLTADSFTIGRDANSGIVVREPAVSRLHAEVRGEGDDYVLHASGATGTKLNGEAVSAPAKLEDGDRIGIGSMEFTFRRGRLPLGVSVVDTITADGHNPDAMTRRDTIKSPILGGSQAAPANQKSSSLPTIAVAVVALGAAVYYFFLR